MEITHAVIFLAYFEIISLMLQTKTINCRFYLFMRRGCDFIKLTKIGVNLRVPNYRDLR